VPVLWIYVLNWSDHGGKCIAIRLIRFLSAVMSRPFNPLTPNDTYRGRTAPLTSKIAFYIFIQQIYVLKILNTVYTLRFFSKCSLFHNSNVFCSCIINILYTDVPKFKKNNSGAKRLRINVMCRTLIKLTPMWLNHSLTNWTCYVYRSRWILKRSETAFDNIINKHRGLRPHLLSLNTRFRHPTYIET